MKWKFFYICYFTHKHRHLRFRPQPQKLEIKKIKTILVASKWLKILGNIKHLDYISTIFCSCRHCAWRREKKNVLISRNIVREWLIWKPVWALINISFMPASDRKRKQSKAGNIKLSDTFGRKDMLRKMRKKYFHYVFDVVMLYTRHG